jgi:hypothetical protein
MDERTERHIGDILKDRNIEIVGADLATRHGFTQVPNFILTNPQLSVGAKLAYAMLLKYAWQDDACFPGQAKLAEDMGSGERSVRRYLDELEKSEFLEIVQRVLARPTCTGCSSSSKNQTPAMAAAERPIWPVWNGHDCRSGTANPAAHSIEEYSF